MRVRLTSLFLMLLCLSSCATWRSTSTAYDVWVNQWVGQTETDLTKALGYSERELMSPTGNKVLEYREYHTEKDPTIGVPAGNMAMYFGGNTREFKCTTWFEIKDSKVAQVTWKGNKCVYPDYSIMGAYLKSFDPENLQNDCHVLRIIAQSPIERIGVKVGDVLQNLVTIRYLETKEGIYSCRTNLSSFIRDCAKDGSRCTIKKIVVKRDGTVLDLD